MTRAATPPAHAPAAPAQNQSTATRPSPALGGTHALRVHVCVSVCKCVCACVCGEANVDVDQIKKNMCSFDRKYGFANDSVRTGRHHDGSAGRGLCVVVVASGRKGRGETGVCTCMAQMSVRAAAPLAGGLAGAAVR